MIIDQHNKAALATKQPYPDLLSAEDDAGPPPPFSDSPPHVSIEMASSTAQLLPPPALAADDAPPGFALYDPEYDVMQSGNIVSHDRHLNEDGEALYRFLLDQSRRPPKMSIHVVGTHTQITYVERVTRTPSGETRVSRQPQTDTITDFSFSIDLTSLLVPPPELYTVPDDEPTFRGHMYRQVMPGTAKRTGNAFRDTWRATAWRNERERKGQAPWSWMNVERARTEGKTVREWADDFCASEKMLKEFDYRKAIYGWDLKAIEGAIQRSIKRTLYTGLVVVTFPKAGTHIYIRPHSHTTRLLMTSIVVKIILWILFIYPFILLFWYLHPRGGGRWAVAGEGWTFRHPTGQRLTEGQWFNVWGPRIVRAAEDRSRSDEVVDATGQVYPSESYSLP